ncbi:MAG: hypothetical protein KF729_13995 [Sandaracinaceae bacterium]|nr:hypothetical protein [Sandaracinaceae bacterium]
MGSACDAAGARWFVFGAQAAILRGVVRRTEDVDFTVDLGDATTRELIDALAREGLHLRVVDAEEFIAATRVLPLRHRASAVPVDVVLAGSGLEDGFFERLETVLVGATPIQIPSLEDLVVMKTLAGRPLDDEDVVALLVANPAHDAEAIRRMLEELQRALDTNDLVPRFDASAARARRAARRRR